MSRKQVTFSITSCLAILMGSGVAMAFPSNSSAESYSTISFSFSLVNLYADLASKQIIQQNLGMKTIVEYFYGFLIPCFKSNVAAIVPKINYLLSALAIIQLAVIISNYDLTKLGFDSTVDEPDRLELVPNEGDSGQLKETMGLLRLQKDRISNKRRSIEQRRRFYNATIMIAVVFMLTVSVGLAVCKEGLAAVVTTALGMGIKAVETCVNMMLNEEERLLKEEEELVEMLRYGEWLMVHEFNDVRKQAKTLKEGIMAEHSNLLGHIQRKERPEMVRTIIKMECSLKALERIVNGYGNNMQQFSLKFNTMVIK